MIRRLIPLVFAFAVAAPAAAEKILTDYGIQLGWTEKYNNRKGEEQVNFFATDVHTNREYVIPMIREGKNWVSYSPVEYKYNPDVGGRPVIVGRASDDVRDRIYGKMSQEADNFRNWLEDQNRKVPGPAEPSQGATAPPVSSPPPADVPSDGIEWPGTIGGSATGDSDWQKSRAQQTPYDVGATLDKLGWGSQAQYAHDKAQNKLIENQQQLVDANLAANLENQGIQDSKIKAQMLISLDHYLKGNPKVSDEAEPKILQSIDLTQEGRKLLQANLLPQRQKQAWNALAKTITILANPWSGNPSDPALKGYADRDGIMLGPAIKKDSLHLAGRKSMVHRIRQVANQIQAYALKDDSWKSGRYMASVVGVAGEAVQNSAMLESLGIKEDAEKLLGFAEAAAEFLNGTDEGIVIGITESLAGTAILTVQGYEAVEYGVTHPGEVADGLRSAGEFFADPEAVAEASIAILNVMVEHTPEVLAGAWDQVVYHVLHDSPREHGRILGQVIAEIGMDILTDQLQAVVKTTQAGKLGRIEKTADELGQVILQKADKVAARSAELSTVKTTTSPYVRALPDIKDLAASESNIIAAERLRDFEASFEGHIFKGELKPGDILFQVQRADQTVPGEFFSVIRPVDAADAEDMLNIFAHGNEAEKLTAFVVKEPVSVYAGAVAGGTGRQVLIPSNKTFGSGFNIDHVLEEVETVKLRFRNTTLGD